MELDFATFRDKVMGCWAGKNIGGVLGAPFEGKRQFNNIDYYVQDLSSGPPPNDDLDLQVIWLAAVERYGRLVDASILGEYWLSYVIPNWAEYGTGKANMQAGFMPPLSGHMDNQYRFSCGCFIRSEIWACLAPGIPDLAVRYAYEDGIVDHSGEGVYGEIFCAALESAAFLESDPQKLIKIGLSYIPADCTVTRCIKLAVECFSQKVDFHEARNRIHNEAPGTFGALRQHLSDLDTEGGKLAIGTAGFDCPENLGFAIAGWLYGEGIFGKSLCLAVACGEDTDCSAATLGAIMGIIQGASGLPEKWTAPINDKIMTLCINKTSEAFFIPDTVTQLTDRVLRVAPLFLGIEYCDILTRGGYTIHCQDKDKLEYRDDDYILHNMADSFPRKINLRELVNLSPYVVRHAFTTHTVLLDYLEEPYFTSDKPRKINIGIINNDTMRERMWCRLHVAAPDNVRILPGSDALIQLNVLYGDRGEASFTIDASEFTGVEIELLIDISMKGRHTSTPIKAMLLRLPEV